MCLLCEALVYVCFGPAFGYESWEVEVPGGLLDLACWAVNGGLSVLPCFGAVLDLA